MSYQVNTLKAHKNRVEDEINVYSVLASERSKEKADKELRLFKLEAELNKAIEQQMLTPPFLEKLRQDTQLETNVLKLEINSIEVGLVTYQVKVSELQKLNADIESALRRLK